MKKVFTFVVAMLTAATMFAGTELFDPAQASINSTYFAPNWEADGVSSATYDAATGTVTVELKSQFNGQWQAQVKLNHNVAFSADKQYQLSCKLKATAALGGITIKMDDNAVVVMANQSVNLAANEEFVFKSDSANGVAENNKILVFDFGWSGPCTITISDISIMEVGEADEPEPVVHPAAAPAPTRETAQVFSIYSDAYTSTVTRATGGWGQQTKEQEVALAEGDNAFYYTNGNYLGWELNSNVTIGDMSLFPNLHMDIYVPEASSIKFAPIWGAEAAKEYSLVQGWNALDIDLVADFASINLKNIYQLKWVAMPAVCYIDNVYFWTDGPTTLLDAQEVFPKVSKTIENGQVVIIREGVKYNVVGAVIEK